MKTVLAIVVGVGALVQGAQAQSLPMQPVSYDMPNGQTGAWNYFDSSYSGNGNRNQAGSFLFGGRGELTDGTIPSQSWNPNYHPWVGWETITPTIVFHFSYPVRLDTVTLHLEDSDGVAGVSAPSMVRIQVDTRSVLEFPVSDPTGTLPFSFTANLGGTTGSSVSVSIIDGVAPWVFLSEVQFTGVPDADLDGVLNQSDNCPTTPNPDQLDCNNNGIGEACETGYADCNSNSTPDSCDIASGTSADADGNGVPDTCQPDCNLNNLPDAWEIATGLVSDLNSDGTPDDCQGARMVRLESSNLGAPSGAAARVWNVAELLPAESGVTITVDLPP